MDKTMNSVSFYLDDDSNCVIKETCVSVNDGLMTSKLEVVMDKKTFKECYKKWILEEEDTQETERSI